jgi:cytochrome c biogenesis protein CcmG, thiol:disulfide interchange protein DsbE
MTNPVEQTQSRALTGRLRTFVRPLGYALLGFALFQWFGRSNSGPKTGELASAFALEVVERPEQRITLAELRGQPAVLEVFAAWCKACRSMAPTMADLARAPRNREVRFLGVAVDTSSKEAVDIHRTWGVPFSVVLADPQFSSDYQIKVLPTIIVLDAEGRVRHVTTGATRASTIDGWLEDLGASRSK